MALARADITGLVVCGGLGTRMGGVDKGLQDHGGVPLALHALRRLAPQVGRVLVNANRNLAAYEAMGAPVYPDTIGGHPGPLAGWLAGLAHCSTPFMATVPCDTPRFPMDLVARLSAALAREGGELAMAATREGGRVVKQPAFCLLRSTLRESLADFLAAGERKVGLWADRQGCVQVVFDDAEAFFNANTREDLDRLRAD